MKTTLNQNHPTNSIQKIKAHLFPIGYRIAFALVIALLIGIASRTEAITSRLSRAMDVPVLVENLMVTKPIPATTTPTENIVEPEQVLGTQSAILAATPLPTLAAIQLNFAKMIGATVSTQGVTVNYAGRKIVNQDGSGGQSNKTVNLYGSRLNVSGNFHVETHISNLSGAVLFSLYGKAPLIYDEFRFDPATVMVRVEKTNLTVDLWNGSKQAAAVHSSFTIPEKTNFELTVENKGSTIAILIDGVQAGSVPSNSIFKSGQVWFGFDSDTPNGHFLITAFEATPLDTGKVTTVDVPASLPVTAKDPNAWASLAAKYPGKTIGAAVALGPLVSDPTYYNLATSGWYNVWTTENALKAQFVHPQPTVYAFEEADAIVDLAQKNHIAIHGHALVFGEANAAWMQTTPANQLESVMKSHITTIVSRYKGKIATWDVVNEPLGDDYWDGPVELRNHIWNKAMGAKYIDTAFITAHAADPNALLFMNEWGLETDSGRFDGFMDLLDGLLQRNIPINGVGFQAHVYESGDEVSQSQLKAHFKQIADLGAKYNHPLKVRISEMDVYGHSSSNQTTQFTQTLKTCMEDPACISFSMWGITEKYSSTSWVDEDDGTLGIGDGLPFGENFEKLGAVTSMQAYLGGTATPTPTPRARRNTRRTRN